MNVPLLTVILALVLVAPASTRPGNAERDVEQSATRTAGQVTFARRTGSDHHAAEGAHDPCRGAGLLGRLFCRLRPEGGPLYPGRRDQAGEGRATWSTMPSPTSSMTIRAAVSDEDPDIPAGESDVRHDGYFRLEKPTLLVSFQPHMQTRGKSICASGRRLCRRCPGVCPPRSARVARILPSAP